MLNKMFVYLSIRSVLRESRAGMVCVCVWGTDNVDGILGGWGTDRLCGWGTDRLGGWGTDRLGGLGTECVTGTDRQCDWGQTDWGDGPDLSIV